jgi:uncharacterized protein (TIGR00251 family)
MKLKETAKGVVLDVYVKPKSSKFRVEVDVDEVIVSCREAPVKGKVNRELVKKLSRLFNIQVELVAGVSTRKKKILIRGIEAEEVNRVLASASNTRQ